MKKIDLWTDQINSNNILDIMYEPDKDRYSVLEYNGNRKEISKEDFHLILIIIEEYCKG